MEMNFDGRQPSIWEKLPRKMIFDEKGSVMEESI